MRLALALLLAVAIGHQAGAQTSDRRPFAEADYEAYFSEGGAFVESPTFASRGVEQYYTSGKTVMLAFVEVMARWDGSSPYPFVKVRGEHPLRFGVLDKTLNARVYERADPAASADDGNQIWLSNDNHAEISPGDKPMGSVRDYYKTLSQAAGRDPEADDAAYRHAVSGRFKYSCAFVKGPAYDVECVDTSMTTGQSVIRRYRRQSGLS